MIQILLILLTAKAVMSSELSDFHNGTVDDVTDKSDASDKAIVIDDTMMKLNYSTVEPDAEIIVTNANGVKSIKRKSELKFFTFLWLLTRGWYGGRIGSNFSPTFPSLWLLIKVDKN